MYIHAYILSLVLWYHVVEAHNHCYTAKMNRHQALLDLEYKRFLTSWRYDFGYRIWHQCFFNYHESSLMTCQAKLRIALRQPVIWLELVPPAKQHVDPWHWQTHNSKQQSWTSETNSHNSNHCLPWRNSKPVVQAVNQISQHADQTHKLDLVAPGDLGNWRAWSAHPGWYCSRSGPQSSVRITGRHGMTPHEMNDMMQMS